ncbi:MAG: DGQHR domain-containing protein [Desulfuromonadales bacterium]|nr:DGQHR domain-containing protein [Desulfuromonadales bacterium]
MPRLSLNSCFILDYDRSIIARLFYTINYTQKSVNKSLLYHLTAEFSTEINEINFLHDVVKALNESEKSPFFKRIKMLGVSPREMDSDDKKMMTLSQAFLIDYFLYTLIAKKVSSAIQPIFYYYYKHDERFAIVRFIVSYFTAAKEILPEWDNPKESMISKSVGVGALIKVLNYVFIKIFIEYNGGFNSQVQQVD